MSLLLFSLAGAAGLQPVPNPYDGGIRPGEWATSMEMTEFSIAVPEEVQEEAWRELARTLAEGSDTEIECMDAEEAANPLAHNMMRSEDDCDMVESVFADGQMLASLRCLDAGGMAMDMTFSGTYTPLAMRVDLTMSGVDQSGFDMELRGRITAVYLGECPVEDE